MERHLLAGACVVRMLTRVAKKKIVIHWNLTVITSQPPSAFNFLIFAPVFTLFSIAYLELAPRLAPQASHPFASLAVEATNAVFYFAGFIALAVYVSHRVFCFGTVCAVGRATSVVAAAEFSSWIATTILLAKDIFKGRLRGSSTDFDVVPSGCLGPLQQQRQQQAGTQAQESQQTQQMQQV